MIKFVAAIVGLLFVYLAFRSRKHPGAAMGLVWCLYAMEQVMQAGFSIFIARSYLLNVAVFGVSAFAALNLAFRTKMFSGIRFPRQVLWALFLFILVALSVAWAPKFGNSLNRLKDGAPYFALFLLVAPMCVLDRNQLEEAIKVLLYFGFVVLIGLAISPIDNRAIVVSSGAGGELTKGNPLAVASFAGCVLLAAVFKIYGMKKKKGAIFLFHVAIIAAGLFVLAQSGSRGQVIACVIAMVIWLPMTARVAANRSSVLAIGVVLVFCVGLYYFVSNGADVNRWQSDQLRAHSSGRLDSAIRLLDTWYDEGGMYLLVGLGSSAAWDTIGGYPHVVPLELIAEEGILGFGFFVAFCFSLTVGGYQVLRSESVDIQSRVNVGLILALFTFQFALSFKQGSLIGSLSLFTFGLTAAWYMTYLKKESKRNSQRNAYNMMLQNAYRPEFIPTQPRR